MSIKLIITGASGMVGEGVLTEALSRNDVEEVLVIGRRPCGIVHPKLKEIIHNDFLNIQPLADKLKGYDGCLFCLGVSSVGMKQETYYTLTYTLTMHFAETLASVNKDAVFCYISGAKTDSTEKGPVNWARVKGKTENDLMKLPFRKVYAFRPGFLKPSPGARNVPSVIRFLLPLYPVVRFLYPIGFCTLAELGNAMINSVLNGYGKNILEVPDITELSKK
jgi:hypothetical protein